MKNNRLSTVITIHKTKIIFGFFFILLLTSYIRIFAIGQPYQPGATLDPACQPSEVNCIVSYDLTFFKQDGNSFSSTATLGTNDANSLVLETNDTARLTINSSGNVGIGTTNPAEKLSLVQNSGADGVNMRISSYTNIGTTASDQATIIANNARVSDTQANRINFLGGSDGASAIEMLYFRGIRFYTAPDGVSRTAGAQFFNNSDPTYLRLQIAGNGTVSTGGQITASSSVARGLNVSNTLIAAANNDQLVALDVSPTFTNGAFTGLTNAAISNTTGNNYFNSTSGATLVGYARTLISGFPISAYKLGVNGGIAANGLIAGTSFDFGGTTFNYTAPNLDLANNILFRWSSTGGSGGSKDTGLTRNSAGWLKITDASTGYGNLISGKLLLNTTTDAGYQLDVNGTGRFTTSTATASNFIAADATTAASGGAGVLIVNNSPTSGNRGSIFFSDSSLSTFYAAIGAIFSDRTNHYAGLHFTVKNAGGYLDALTITSAGAATFSSALSTTSITATSLTSGRVPIVSTGGVLVDSSVMTFVGGSTLTITNGNIDVKGLDNARVNLTAESSSNPMVSFLDNAGNAQFGILKFYDLTFKNGTTSVGKITNGGNWLIGTTTDGGYKLDVNGTGRFIGSIVLQTSGSLSERATDLTGQGGITIPTGSTVLQNSNSSNNAGIAINDRGGNPLLLTNSGSPRLSYLKLFGGFITDGLADTQASSLELNSGVGTGAGSAASILFKTDNVGSSGSTAHTLTTRLTINSTAATFTLPTIINTNVSGGSTAFEVKYNGSSLFKIAENAITTFGTTITTPSGTGLSFGGNNAGVGARNHFSFNLTNGASPAAGDVTTLVAFGGTWTNQTSGQSVMLNINPTYNFNGNTTTGVARGIYYNPTLTNIGTATHIAIETVTGDNYFGTTSGNVGIGLASGATLNYKLDVSGLTRFRGAYATPSSSAGTGTLTIHSSDAAAQNKGGSIGLGGNGASSNINFATIIGAREISSGDRGYFAVYTNGTSYAERFRVSSDGFFEIGTTSTSPTAAFIVSNTYTSSGTLGIGSRFNQTITASANNDVLVGLDISPTFTNGAFTGVSNIALRTITGDVFLGTTSGNVSIGNTNSTYKLEVGSASVSGIVARFVNSTGTCDINPTTTALACSSDRTLKKNITPLDTSILDKVLNLNPVTYNWNSESDSTPLHNGFIAQEVESIFPDLVFTDASTGLKSLNYMGLIPYTIKALQQLNLKVTMLPEFEDQTLAEKVMVFLEGVAHGKVQTEEVQTDKLCVGSVCVTQEQFLNMINNSNSSSIGPSQSTPPAEDPIVEEPENNTPEAPAEEQQPQEEIQAPIQEGN